MKYYYEPRWPEGHYSLAQYIFQQRTPAAHYFPKVRAQCMYYRCTLYYQPLRLRIYPISALVLQYVFAQDYTIVEATRTHSYTGAPTTCDGFQFQHN